MALNDSEILVLQTIVMRFNEHDSMAWIHSHQTNKKKPMEIRQFYRIKGKLKGSTQKRKFELQKIGLWEQHIERIDQLENHTETIMGKIIIGNKTLLDDKTY